MAILGIALIVVGLALVCGGLIAGRRPLATEALATDEEERTESRSEETKPEGERAPRFRSEPDPISELADLLGRRDRSPDDDRFK